MSCYIRYMKNVLNEMNIEPQTKEDRKHIDLTIREIIGKKGGINVVKSGKKLKSGFKNLQRNRN